MANEVEIRITADDATGPAFTSVMGRLAALKAAADAAAADRQMKFDIGDAMAKVAALRSAMEGLKIGGIDMSSLDASLMALRSKMQSIGIADIADINVQPGRLMTQLHLIKRLMDQAGISDILDFNLTPADLAQQLAKIGEVSFHIPVRFDMSRLPSLGAIGTEHIPIVFDMAKIPVAGPTGQILNIPANINVKEFIQAGEVMPVLRIPATIDIKDIPVSGPTMPILNIPAKIDLGNIPIAGEFAQLQTNLENAISAEGKMTAGTSALGTALTAADMAITPFLSKILDMAPKAADAGKYMSFLGMSFAEMIPWVEKLGEVLTYSTMPSMIDFTKAAELGGSVLLNFVSVGFYKASDGVTKFSKAIDSGVPLWKSAGGIWGGLTGKLQLFGGWLTKLGAPAWIGAVSGLHILVEGIMELSAILIPASIAFGIFAAAAVPTIKDMYTAEQNINTVAQALNTTLPGLSGNFAKIENAVQPNVYILFGEALGVINSKTGEFQMIAQGAGQVVDNLGARIAMALGGNGLTGFISHGVDDLQNLGDVIGNVFGIFGNLLKTLPGYAEILLGVFKNITGVLENITASSAVQEIAKLALALHGAIFYAGLAVTGLFALRAPLTSIAVWALDGVSTLAALGAMFLEAAADEGIMAAAMDMVSLIDPWILAAAAVAAVVAGLVILVSWLHNSVNAQRAYLNSVEDTIGVQTTFAGIITTTQGALNNTNTELSKTPQYVQGVTSNFRGLTTEGQKVNDTYTNLKNNSKFLTDQLATESNRQKELIGIFGSSTAAQDAMQQAGIKLSDIADANSAAWAKDIVELKALNNATIALAGFQGGQAAAMQNALNVMGGTITQIQKITQAQDGLMNSVTANVNAFDTFALGQITLSGNFGLTAKQAQTVSHSLGDIKLSATTAGATMGGLNQASLTLSQSFYSQVTNAQKVIDSLEQAQTPTNQMTDAVGALVGQMLPFAQNDEAARATLVALINDALGPGTVSLQNLNQWVKQNATSMGGLNNIIEQATVKAGTLANVLDQQLNQQFETALLKSSGATQAIQDYANALTNGATDIAGTAAARQNLINDLEKTGMSAHDATSYVDGLQKKIDAMHGTNVPVNVSVMITTAIQNQLAAGGVTNAIRYGGFASGGIVGHAASGGMRNGLTVVGELGPELVRLPQGSQVYPTGVTPGYANQGGGWGSMSITLSTQGGRSVFDQFMAEWIRNFVRVKGGGSVQKAFGKNG